MKTRIFDTIDPIKQYTLTGLLLLIFLFPCILQAQCYSHKIKPVGFKKGDMTINAGIGLLPTFRGNNLSLQGPPICMIINYRIRQNVTTGIYLGYSLTEATLTRENGKTIDVKNVLNNFYLVGLRLEGHYIRDRADFYGGAMLAYNFSDIDSNLKKYPEYTNIRVENYSDIVTWSGHIGFKYLLTKNFGLFTEIGYGVSVFVIGTSFKL